MTKSSKQLEQLFAAIGNAQHVLILTHNNPDPDAIASAVALKYLLQEKLSVKSQIAYKGIIGRAENKALVRYLNQPLRRLMPADLNGVAPIALVDTQPGAGNNALPPPHSGRYSDRPPSPAKGHSNRNLQRCSPGCWLNRKYHGPVL